MLADFFTKPLSGLLFNQYRDIIMGYKNIDSLSNDTFSIKECVRNVSENANEKQSTEKRGNNKSNKLTYADIVKGKRNNKKDNE